MDRQRDDHDGGAVARTDAGTVAPQCSFWRGNVDVRGRRIDCAVRAVMAMTPLLARCWARVLPGSASSVSVWCAPASVRPYRRPLCIFVY